MFELELSKREREVLQDILRTEIFEVEDMIKDDDDKEELSSYLNVVKSISSKLVFKKRNEKGLRC